MTLVPSKLWIYSHIEKKPVAWLLHQITRHLIQEGLKLVLINKGAMNGLDSVLPSAIGLHLKYLIMVAEPSVYICIWGRL